MFMRLVPAPSTPRRPAVPNFRATAKRSLISSSLPSILLSSGFRSASSRSAASQRLYSSRYILHTLPLIRISHRDSFSKPTYTINFPRHCVNSILCKNFRSANHTNTTKISAFSIIRGFRAVRSACGSARALTSPLPATIIGTIEYSAETGHFPGHFPVGPQTRREEAPCIPF